MIHINKYIYAPVVHHVKFISWNSHFRGRIYLNWSNQTALHIFNNQNKEGHHILAFTRSMLICPLCLQNEDFAFTRSPAPAPPPSLPTVSRFRLHPQPLPLPPALRPLCLQYQDFRLHPHKNWRGIPRFSPSTRQITLIMIRNSDKIK